MTGVHFRSISFFTGFIIPAFIDPVKIYMASFPPSLHGHPRSPIEDTSVIFTCMSQKPCKMPSLLLVKSIGHRSCRADERVIDRRFICLKRAGVRATEGICSGSRSGVTRDARL
jgi:hypothetical protein